MGDALDSGSKSIPRVRVDWIGREHFTRYRVSLCLGRTHQLCGQISRLLVVAERQ